MLIKIMGFVLFWYMVVICCDIYVYGGNKYRKYYLINDIYMFFFNIGENGCWF